MKFRDINQDKIIKPLECYECGYRGHSIDMQFGNPPVSLCFSCLHLAEELAFPHKERGWFVPLPQTDKDDVERLFLGFGEDREYFDTWLNKEEFDSLKCLNALDCEAEYSTRLMEELKSQLMATSVRIFKKWRMKTRGW